MSEENKHAATAVSIAAQEPLELPAVVSESASLMAVIAKAAADPNTDVDKMERLMGMYERTKAASAKAAYYSGLSEMQDEMPVIHERGEIKIDRNSTKPGQKYALFEDINKAIKPILKSHGFALSFRTGMTDGKITVTGILSHRDGHSEETTIHLPTDTSGSKNAVQAVGSSTSYGRRYTTMSLLNITSTGDDDDGSAAGIGNQIEDYQADQLLNLAEKAFQEPEKKAHLIARICKKFGIENITQMQVKDFGEACTLLNDTITNVRAKAAEVAK